MPAKRRDGTPIWLDSNSGSQTSLLRVDLGGSAGAFTEDWLQKLLEANPAVLPIEQIEPGFGSLIPVCRELPLRFGAGRSGALDNLFMTAQGGLVLVEAKLWRNPEARRTVVAQAMEYASALFSLDYEALEAAVRTARGGASNFDGLFALVGSTDTDQDEASFVDAVTRNLRRGRAIVLVVGDGIREDILPLANLLQSHAGQRFTFGLVELAVFESPVPGVRMVVPSVLAQTALIERGVVQIHDGGAHGPQVSILEPVVLEPSRQGASRAIGITEDEFMEALAQRDPALPTLLTVFLERLDALGITPDLKRGMSLKHRMPTGNDLNLGTIGRDGYLDTGPATWWGRTAIGRAYNDRLAALIGGFVRDIKQGTESAVRTADGKTPRLSDFLPEHADEWVLAAADYVKAFDTE